MTNVQNVRLGKPKIGGALYFTSDKTTPLPTDEKVALNSNFKEMGYVSADGVQRSIAKAYEIIRAWGGDEVARPRTELTVTFTFTLIESSNGDVLKAIWGEDAVTITPATSESGTKAAVAYGGKDGPDGAWVIELADGDSVGRVVLPVTKQVTESFDQTFGDSQVIAYPVTLTLYRDKNQKYFYEYTNDGVKSA